MPRASFPAFTALPDLQNLPFLLRLMDDDSPAVREKIAAQLRALGEAAWPEIERRQLTLTSEQKKLLESILESGASLESSWLDWLDLERESERLEAAFGHLSLERAKNLTPPADIQLRQALDALAREYLMSGGAPDPEELSDFLFGEKGLAGAASENYYAPQNSDLRLVIENRCGLPISLACIFILVGARLDIEIFGCDLPGHFLARAPFGSDEEADLFFDCFNAGRVLVPSEVEALRKSAPRAMSTPAHAKEIIARVLRNYATAHHVAGNREDTMFYLSLLQQLEASES